MHQRFSICPYLLVGFGGSSLLLAGCASSVKHAWYQPSALIIGVTAPNLISSPPISGREGGGTRHNGSLSQIGAAASLTFPLFPTPTQPERPAAPPVLSPLTRASKDDGQP